MKSTRKGFVWFFLGGAAALAGCVSEPSAVQEPIRVATYNIRLSGNGSWVADRGTPNTWESRKADVAALVRSLDLDVFNFKGRHPSDSAVFGCNRGSFYKIAWL